MELSTNFLKVDFPFDIQSLQENVAEYDWTRFNIIWVVVLSVLWYSARTSLNLITEKNSGRIITLAHAFLTVSLGLASFLEIIGFGRDFFNFQKQFDALFTNQVALVLSNIVACSSISFFIVDSFYVNSTYLKHHIAAVLGWFLTVYHYDTSRIIGFSCICFFEMGALCVQFSRFFPNNKPYRTFFCLGYTFSRLVLIQQTLFIFYYTHTLDQPLWCFVLNYGIDVTVVFLMILNISWTVAQWKLLIKLYRATPGRAAEVKDFFTAHQEIIGNAPSKKN